MNYEKTIDLYDDGIGKVQYIQHYGNDKMIVNSARVSYGRDNVSPLDERDVKLIKYLLKNKHTSVFECCGITFKFTVPLFVRGQHHRHRVWSFNEESRRFTEKNIQFYEPKTFRTQHIKNHQASNNDKINPTVIYCGQERNVSLAIVEANSDMFNLYHDLLGAGICREQARMVLPQSMYTNYYGTVNLNNLMKFIVLRDSKHAQWEIQVVAQACKEIAKDLFPEAITAFNEIVKQGENNDI